MAPERGSPSGLEIWVVGMVWVLGACGDSGQGRDVDAGPDTLVTVSSLAVVVRPRNPLSYYATWRTDYPLTTELAVDCASASGPEYHQTFVGTAGTRRDHEVFVMGLYDGLACTFTAHPSREAITGTLTAVVERVGPPPGILPLLSVNVVDASRMEPGWTLFSVGHASEPSDMFVVIIDAQGRYRWSDSVGTSYYGAGAELAVTDYGLVVGNATSQSQITSWEGEPVWMLNAAAHHDLRISPFGADRVLFLGTSGQGCDTVEHTAVEMDMLSREVVWEWRLCDWWTPRVAYDNWSHLNTIEPVPTERAVLLSSRQQDALFKVNRDTDELEWVLGVDGDFVMDPADGFLRQHAPEILPDGTILVFDNGLGEHESPLDGVAAREYSRVLQFALTFHADGSPDRADVVWEYTDPSIFALNRSEADRLLGGNTLIHYCWVQPDKHVILREVTSGGEIVWDVSTPPEVSSYRSERIAPYYGHVVE